ncbi:MAG: hypothetical protein GY868_00475 [Deltaproteobacteria bacterium]|nr:hypothetical protein [Deltaproteobacteria bacterium]
MNTQRCISMVLTVVLLLLTGACGRTPSRYLGKDHRQVLEIEGFEIENFIDISFDKRGSATVKDITFKAADSYVYTVEFRDFSPFEGTIRWIPHHEDNSLIQSRRFSRITGRPVNLKLPEDCKEIMAVDITYEKGDERTKNLTYLSSNGKILSKEYREGFIDRHFGGWLEVKGKG